MGFSEYAQELTTFSQTKLQEAAAKRRRFKGKNTNKNSKQLAEEQEKLIREARIRLYGDINNNSNNHNNNNSNKITIDDQEEDSDDDDD
eukprot:318213_1